MADETLPLGLEALGAAERVRVERADGEGGGYTVLVEGQAVLRARENPWGLVGLLAGKERDLRIDVYDNQGLKVMQVSRPFSLGGEAARVTLGGRPAAQLRRELTFFRPVLTLHEPDGALFARVKGPIDTSGDCYFKVYSESKEQTGVVCARRSADRGRHFELRLPRDAPVGHKAALLAACFLIDFLYFQN